MARLIVKSPYIKGGGAGGSPGGYLTCIGTRQGVELLPAGYMEYMAERPHSHGLFGDEDNVDMDTAMNELNEHPGNIWSHVISLEREDAERLEYDHAVQWRNLIRAHRNEIAAAMNIPPSDFRWYAAFHDEGDHPHIHMMAWSTKPGQAYLSKEGIRKIKSALTNDIFKQEMLHTYEQKSESRDELVRRTREEMKVLAQEMQISLGSHPEVELLMMTLVIQLDSVTGKKKYGYLSKGVKKTVDEIVDRMEQLPVINECYQVWWELQCQVEDFYSEKGRRRPPPSEQETGNQFAQYALGKLYLDRQDPEQAHYWFSQAAAQGNEYAQFFLDRWDSLKSPSVMLSVSRLLHHIGRIFQEQMPAPPVSGGIQVDRKLMAKIREKKIAMGHKPDDHAEPTQEQMMGM